MLTACHSAACRCDCSLCGFSAASAAAAEDGGDAAAEEEGDHGRQSDPEPQLQRIAEVSGFNALDISYVEGADSVEVVVDVAELNMFQALSVRHAKLLVLEE